MAVEDHSNSTAWTATTNCWETSAGSLENTVTFESSLSLINDDHHDSTQNSSSSSPLVLHPSSADSAPCEITIRLDQKHEIQQVYIRSTARVYEMYYASDLQSGNEYLCTVRCGIALRDDEVLYAYANKEVLAEHKSRSHSKSGSSEDDWVEVKVPDGPKDSLPLKSDSSSGGTAQIYYEATAEIEDVNPCRSITLRLLSLQDKDCLYVDEVYVFADPVDTADSEINTGPVDSSTGSSLMAMLVPTLLQLSKSSGINQIKERNSCELGENSKYLQTAAITADSSNDASRVVQGKSSSISDLQIKSQVVNEISALQAQKITACVPDMGSKPDFARRADAEKITEEKPDCHSSSHIERTLDQLISRVSKIEDLFLRFEENMVKPINRIEGRLQLVEQKLEELTKLPQNPELPHCTRISAPEFSDSDLDSVSPRFNGSENADSEAVKEEKIVCRDNLSTSANAIKLLPSLVITVPEFSTDENEESILPTDSHKTNSKQDLAVNEEESTIELDKNLSSEKPKQRFSVDDALASAFAGFLQSTSAHRQNYVQTLAVKAPEFPSEEGPNDKHHATSDESNEGELEEDSGSTSARILSVESEETMVKRFPWDCSEGAAEVLHNEGLEGCELWGTDIDSTADPEKHSNHSDTCEKTERIGSQNGDENCNLAAQTDCSGDSLRSRFSAADQDNTVANIETTVVKDIRTGFRHDGQEDVIASTNLVITKDGTTKCSKPNDPEVTTASTKLTNSTDVTTRSNLKALHDVLKLTCASSLVDFHSPVLDVKFTSQENQGARISIETLFGDVKEEGADIKEEAKEVPCSGECKDGISIAGPNNLITVEDAELVDFAADPHFSVDMDYCKLLDAPSNSGDENLQEMSTQSDQEKSPASLI